MKFEATAITLVGVASSLGAEAKNSGIFSTLKDMPDQVFRDVPSLQEKERESRARFVSQIGGAIHSRSLQQDDNTGSTNNDDSQWGSVQNRYGDFWNPDLAVKDFGFDINSYSLKVTGCHTVGGYDEDVAENKNYDTVLGTDSFVTFRLCETGSCQGDGGYSYGCTSNFGEYMVPLGQYVEAQTNYRYDRKEAFCQYCEYCAAMTGYKSWNTMMQGTLQGLATAAQDYFDDWFQQYYYDYRFGDEYVGDSGFDEDAFLADAKIVFWKAAQSQDNAYDDNYADQTAEASYFDIFQTYSQFWDYQKNPEFFQDNGNQQSQDWADMDGQYPKYCGRPILNGYFSETGDFEEAWGYFNATGDFVSFESGEPMIWDEECHGTMPNGWEYVMGTDPEEFEECDDQYSKACSSSFLDCQFTLYFDDMDALYEQLVANAGNDGSSSQSQQIKNFESIYESEAAEHSFTQALNCQKVDYPNNDEQLQDSTYANQINFEQLYKQKKAYSEAAADCDKYENDDYDTCMYELQIKIDANLQYIQWIIKSAWDKYKTYQAMNAEYYVGAYCKSKDSIGLQVFADQNCMVPHPSASVSDVLGDVMDSGYNLVSSECIPCNNVSALERNSTCVSPDDLQTLNVSDAHLSNIVMIFRNNSIGRGKMMREIMRMVKF